MMRLLVLVSMLISWNALATQVDGEIFYKKPDGDLAIRSVTLDVPSRGNGEVILSNGQFEWRSNKFYSRKIAGKEAFIVIFNTEFRGEKSFVALVGTYIRANNQIRYYGDLFKRKSNGAPLSRGLKGFTFVGGFDFKYDR